MSESARRGDDGRAQRDQPPVPALEHLHTQEAIRERIGGNARYFYLRDWVFGGIDGAVTTFAVVSGVAGAELGWRIVMILGVANLLADGLSMAASNYLGTTAERDEIRLAEAIERRHIEAAPAGEREEVREIFRQKGIQGETLDAVVEQITRNRQQWLDTMLREEYGLPRGVRSPFLAGLSTFSAFVVCGAVPLVPFALGMPDAFVAACVATAFVFAVVGAIKGNWSPRGRWRSAVETLAIGSAAASVAYVAGAFLKGLT